MNIYGRTVKGFTEEGIMNSDLNGRRGEVFSKEMNRTWPYRNVRRWREHRGPSWISTFL